MITEAQFKAMALKLEGVTQSPHFEKIAFKINNKIFATLHATGNLAVVKLSLPDQSAFCAFDDTIIYPVPNKWGAQGWTNINLSKVLKSTLHDALNTAYNTVKSKK